MSVTSSLTCSSHRQRGMSLIELLVSLALGLAVLVGLSSVYVAAKQSFRFQETSGRLQEDATFALETIARDLRMAGFAGCRGVEVTAGPVYAPSTSLATAPTAIDGPNPLASVESTNATVTVQPMTPYNFLRGFDGVPSAMFAVSSVPTSGTTDSVFFSGGGANALAVTGVMASPSASLTILTDTFGWRDATANSGVYNMIVSDCSSSSVFAGKVPSAGTSIDHSAAIGNALDAFNGSPLYGIDALVMPLEWNFFYIATRTGAATPSLYRVFYDGNERKAAQEVVSNVESMKLHYGENLNGKDSVTGLACTLSSGGATCLPTLQADTWRTTAGAVTDWSRVVAVRIGLMMVSSDSKANSDTFIAAPPLLGASYSIPSGASSSRVRKEFSTTVVLRNRVSPR